MMTISPPTQWISAEEFTREWRRLMDLDLPPDAAESNQLLERLGRRNDELFERYGRPLVAQHPNRWVAIATDGRVLIRDYSWEARRDGEAAYGVHNFAVRKLNDEFQGHRIRH
jgi:hypothetical protein